MINAFDDIEEELLVVEKTTKNCILEKKQVKELIDKMEGELGRHPEVMAEREAYIMLRAAAGSFPQCESLLRKRMLDLITTGFQKMLDIGEVDADTRLAAVQGYVLLTYMLLYRIEHLKEPGCYLKEKNSILGAYIKVCENRKNIFSEENQSQTVRAIIKSIGCLVISQENLKNADLRKTTKNILCLSILKYNFSEYISTSIMNSFKLFEHLSVYYAELVCVLREKEISETLSETLLCGIGEMKTLEAQTAKAVSSFILHLCDFCAEIISRNISSILLQLESESPLLRHTVVYCVQTLIREVKKQDPSQLLSDTDGFFSILEERLRDVSVYVRARTIAAYIFLCKERCLSVQKRSRL